jgi:DNA-binding CsgD family transcriptional regulator
VHSAERLCEILEEIHRIGGTSADKCLDHRMELKAFRDKYLHISIAPNEKSYLEMGIDGYDNDEIAAKLFLSPLTVRDYQRSLMRKLGVRGRTNLAFAAARLGLIDRDVYDIIDGLNKRKQVV